MKTCTKCGQEKELADFYDHPNTKDRKLALCIVCTRRINTENRRAKKDYYREYEKKRSQSQERKSYQRLQVIKHRERHPERYKARTAVNNALRDKRLIRLPCEVCGNVKTEAHHDDYSKPLEVRWLCRKHHREIKE